MQTDASDWENLIYEIGNYDFAFFSVLLSFVSAWFLLISQFPYRPSANPQWQSWRFDRLDFILESSQEPLG